MAAQVVLVVLFSHQSFCEANEAAVVEAEEVAVALDYLPCGLWPHRALAAFAEIAERLRRLSFAARAWPLLRPPRRPRATAAGFFGLSAGGWNFGA